MTRAECKRRRAEQATVLFLLFLHLSGCNPSEPPDAPADTPTHATAHFDFVLYDGLSWSQVSPSLEPMEAEYPRITNDLQVPEPPRVRVEVWASRTAFDSAMQATLGVTYRGATGYVLGTTGVRLLLNQNTARESVHEFAHVVSLNLNPTIANNPRWLWEAVAVYEAGQFVDPHSLPYLVQGDYPTLAELNTAYNDGRQKIYEVGYLLCEFVVVRWGRAAVVDLIRANGNTTAALGLFQEDFQAAWHEYIRERYFSLATSPAARTWDTLRPARTRSRSSSTLSHGGYRLHSAPAFMPGAREVHFSAMARPVGMVVCDASLRVSESDMQRHDFLKTCAAAACGCCTVGVLTPPSVRAEADTLRPDRK